MPKSKTIYRPLGVRLNMDTERHLIRPYETPWAQNAKIGDGTWKCREGWLPVFEFYGEFYGGIIPTTGDYALLTFVDDRTGNVSLYEWDMSTMPGAQVGDWNPLQEIDAGEPEAGIWLLATGFSKLRTNDDNSKAKWQFIQHYDRNLGRCIVGTNGEDLPIVYYVEHPTNPADDRTVENLPFTDMVVIGRGLSANKDAIYFSYCGVGATEGDARAEITAGQHRFQTVYSLPGDGREYDSSRRQQERNEQNLPISGIIRHRDAIYVGQQDYELWQVAAYNNWTNISDEVGFSSFNGQISADTLYYWSNGRVFASQGVEGVSFLSEPIYRQMAGESVSDWKNITSAQDRFNRDLMWATGTKIYRWSRRYGTWMIEDYGSEVELVGGLPPHQRFLYQWAGVVADHKIILAEEDLLSDFCFVLGNKTLARKAPNYQDNGANILSQLDIWWEDAGNPDVEKTWLKWKMLGESDDVVTVYGDFSDTPRQPVFNTAIGTITLESNGYGEIPITARRSRYATIRMEISCSNRINITKGGFEFYADKDTSRGT